MSVRLCDIYRNVAKVYKILKVVKIKSISKVINK